MMKPLRLNNARAWRTYLGGSLIRKIQTGVTTPDDHFPEDWIMSIVEARNPGRENIPNEGLSRLEEGDKPLLKDFILSNPAKLLGHDFIKKNGVSLGVLIKVIDSAERLTVQVHPDKEQASKLFHSPYGKTECWHILGTRIINGEEPCIFLGFKPEITRELWKFLFDNQDISGMLSCLHRFPVHYGETIFIEGGVPHAIGCGCLLVEIQEPTDYTIRIERTTPSGFKIDDQQCHQGLGFERMFDCFHYESYSEQETKARWFVPAKRLDNCTTSLIGYDKTNMFALNSVSIPKGYNYKLQFPNYFSGLYVLEGEGEMICNGFSQNLSPSNEFFVPACCPSVQLYARKKLKLLHFFGPNCE